MCANPFEFESFYKDDDEIMILFEVSDYLMNPKSDHRNSSDQIPRIQDIVGNALNLPEVEDILSTVVTKLKQNSILTKDKVLALRP